MNDRFSALPSYLAERVKVIKLADVPVMLAHPDWSTPAPIVIWLHGRTANKELDPGRYLRWIRAGLAACAVDLPGHGERLDTAMQTAERSLDLIESGLAEVDRIVEALSGSELAQHFRLDRMGIGGMSAGGMIALRRLCDSHRFACAAVEATTGNLADLYHPASGRRGPVNHPPDRIAKLDPMKHLADWRPLPLLALHTEADRLIPIEGQRKFVEALRRRYSETGADPSLIEWHTWPSTGAPEEHIGFGRFSNDAKNMQTAFFVKHLLG